MVLKTGEKIPLKGMIIKHSYLLAKVLILLVTYGYICYELFVRNNSDNWNFVFDSDLRPGNYYYLYMVFMLLPANILTDTFIWRFLVRKIEVINIKTSIKAVLSGMTMSIFTPNRIGEIASRIFVLKRENRKAAIFSSAAGKLASLVITVFLGLISSVLFLILYSSDVFLAGNKIYYFGIPIIILGIIIILLYIFLPEFSLKISGLKIFSKIRQPLFVLTSYKRTELLKVLILSFLRYIIYTSQFLLILFFFNVNLTIQEAYITISLTYLFLSFIPSIALAEIGIRGSVSLFFIGYFSDNTIGILAASTCIWIINVVLPAIAGSVLLYKIKF